MLRGVVRRAIAVGCGAVLGTVLLASPAHADHVAQITSDGSLCVLGPFAGGPFLGLGFGLRTDKASIDIDRATGDLTYQCKFDVPAHVAARDNVWGREWNLPGRAVKYAWPRCFAPGSFDARTQSDEASLLITPSGQGILRCTFWAFAPTG